MADLFFESLALQRIDLIARLVANNQCDGEDRDMAIVWIAEMTSELTIELDKYQKKGPHGGGRWSGG